MLQFLGEYNCKLDDKGRLRMPAPLLKQMEGMVEAGFVLNRGFEKCLVLYPKTAWTNITQEIQKLNLYVKKNRDFVRYFFRGASELEIDSSQRLLLPKSLSDYAEVDKEVILFAYFDRIEIWAKEQYDNFLDEEPQDFADLAEEVMGKIQMGHGQSDTDLS
jgi:MraZ protein